MQVSVESTGTLERRMEVQVPAEQVEKAVDERLQQMSRTVRLKGFRPGKVPVKVVRQQFGQQVRQEVLGDVMQSSFAEAVVQEKLTPAGGPRIEPINLEQGGDLKYRAVFEIVPQIQLKGLDTLPVERPAAEVSQRRRRRDDPEPARAAADVSRASSARRGTPIASPWISTAPSTVSRSKAAEGENIPIVLGAGRMLADFEAGLHGARAGEREHDRADVPAELRCRRHSPASRREFAVTGEVRRGAPAARARRRVLQGVRRGGGRHRRSCARSRREHEPRARRCDPRAPEEAGAGRPRRGEPDRAAEVDGRRAGARAADRRCAPHGRAGRFADSAARCVPGSCAPSCCS